jgi:hypothetical protein
MSVRRQYVDSLSRKDRPLSASGARLFVIAVQTSNGELG